MTEIHTGSGRWLESQAGESIAGDTRDRAWGARRDDDWPTQDAVVARLQAGLNIEKVTGSCVTSRSTARHTERRPSSWQHDIEQGKHPEAAEGVGGTTTKESVADTQRA